MNISQWTRKFDWFSAPNCYCLSKFILLCCPHQPQTHRNKYLINFRI